MERLIYTKYSNQRHPDYAIRTDIVCREEAALCVNMQIQDWHVRILNI